MEQIKELNHYVRTKLAPSQIDGVGVFALRDIKGFGALDDDNHFYIWGERPNGTIYDSPYILSNSSRFYEDSVFVNSKEFILKKLFLFE